MAKKDTKSTKLVKRPRWNMEHAPTIPKTKSLQKLTAMKCIYTDLVKGVQRSEIMNRLRADYYGIGVKWSNEHNNTVYDEALKILRDDMAVEMRDLRIGILSKAFDVYKEAREAHDRTNALKALNFISQITGALDPKYAQTHVQTVTIDFNFSDNEDNETEYEEVEEVNEC